MDIETLSGAYLVITVVIASFLLILAILWILVPFAVFGVKPLLRDLIAEQRRTYEMLAAVSQQLHNASQVAVVDRPANTTVVETTRPVDPLSSRY